MLMCWRRAAKPECISAETARAFARSAASAGQSWRWRSARYSRMASESHTSVLPSRRRGARQLDCIGLEARHHRSVVGVGDREAAEKQRALLAEALATRAPDGDDALDIAARIGVHAFAGVAAADVHRHRAAQRLEARMH